LIKKTGRYWK